MRGAPSAVLPFSSPLGIIPAYAGSTNVVFLGRGRCGGSSPRMRGALYSSRIIFDTARIIPAYAGSTGLSRTRQWRNRDHPRVCGEHVKQVIRKARSQGSSPRMRGARHGALGDVADRGIIPAYAGSTRPEGGFLMAQTDHPRVCGEHIIKRAGVNDKWGSSPRMRGAHGMRGKSTKAHGIIPAYAGEHLDTLGSIGSSA